MVGAVANAAAQDPRVQQAAIGAAGAAAGDAARRGGSFVKTELVEIKTYIQENHCSIRIFCFCIALALFTSSILGLINLFEAFFSPLMYLMAVYNMLFALVILVMDGKPDWDEKCCGAQRRLYSAVPILAGTPGRAAFYFYVGSMNIVLLPESWLWKLIYIGIGGSLCVAGIMMVCEHFCSQRNAANTYKDGEVGP